MTIVVLDPVSGKPILIEVPRPTEAGIGRSA